MDLGSELRHARERLGLSLADVATRTKIRATTLGAIENDELDRLPPPIFTRGFLKAFAREVGLDPDAVAARYAAALQDVDDARRGTAPPLANHAAEDSWTRPGFTLNRSGVETAVLVLVAGLLVILLNRSQTPHNGTPRRDGADSPQAAATQGRGEGEASVATTGSPSVTNAPGGARRGLMRIELLPQGPCWIDATADGDRIIYKLLNAGDRYVIEGHDELILRVGDPARFAFSIDGAAGRSLGPAGQPTTVRITRANAHEFIGAR